MLKAPTKERKREVIVVFDPEQQEPEDVPAALPKRKRVAAYARVSTEQDAQQNSFEAQKNYYTEFIQSKPEWEFVGVYADEGITGTSVAKRAGFQKMIEDAGAGKIDLILTKSISRFARNTVDSLSVTRQLKAKGIGVFFEKENIDSLDPRAELIFTILSSIAQEESRSISENVRWGQKRSMEAGNVHVAWSRFLGYEKGPDGTPVIVEDQAEIVKEIYKLFLEGKTLREIARILEEKKLDSPTGEKTWYTETIKSILSNEKYKGDARLQKTYTVDFLSKEKHVNNGERKQWYIKGSHEPIVSEETFELAQQELERRCGRRGKYYDSPFTGKIICGVCGALYGHRVWNSNDKYRKNIWLCNDKYKGEEICRVPRLTDEEIEKAFVIAFNRLPMDKKQYCEEYERDYLPMVGDTTAFEEQLSQYRAEMKSLADEADELVADNASRVQNQDEYNREYLSLSTRIDETKAKIDSAKQQISDALIRRENARIFLEGLSKAPELMVKFDVASWIALVQYVKVMPDNSLIFHFRNGKDEIVSLEEAH